MVSEYKKTSNFAFQLPRTRILSSDIYSGTRFKESLQAGPILFYWASDSNIRVDDIWIAMSFKNRASNA